MTSIQTTQNTITIQPLYKWDLEESQMTYLNLYSHYLLKLSQRSRNITRVRSDRL